MTNWSPPPPPSYMILFLGMPRLVTVAHAVIAGTCDVSLRTASQSTLKASVGRWAMLWEMSAVKACVRCVGVLALALGLMLGVMPREAAGMYRNWRKQHSKRILCLIPFSPLLFSHLCYYFCISLPSLLLLCSVTVLSLSTPCRQVFWTETKDWCVSSCGCAVVRVKPLPRSSGEQWKRPGVVTGQV